MKMNMNKKIWNTLKKIFGRKEELSYPIPCIFIDFTSEAKRNNIKDDENKIIIKHYINQYGNLSFKKFKYSEAFVNIQKNKKIPIFDRTKEEQKFVVISIRDPAQIKIQT